jgi:5-formyltetrahydrofolate cyclo-ligase
MESAQKLHDRMLATARELEIANVEDMSMSIQKRVLLMEEFRLAMRIGIYAPMFNEVRTELIFAEGNRHRKEMYFPAVDEAQGALNFYRVTAFDELAPGYAGILEPTSVASKLRNLSSLDTLIVPGVAFDLHGGRIGYGRNYYNNCLKDFRGKRVALAYDFQIVSELPIGVRGRKVDWIVTEKRMIRCQ